MATVVLAECGVAKTAASRFTQALRHCARIACGTASQPPLFADSILPTGSRGSRPRPPSQVLCVRDDRVLEEIA